ncbi:MAG TPA: iron ABC transporter permease [Solirubrobacteraceae bacterium]
MAATALESDRLREGGAEHAPAARRSRPWLLLGGSAAVAVVLALPLVFLFIEAAGSGVSTVSSLIFRSLTATLLWNTVQLTAVVTLLCAIIGVVLAWFVERTDLPGRRIWAVLVVIPLAIPDFVVSFGWSSISTAITGFRGAVLVMTLAVYPLVYLPVAASFRNADPGQEEAARSLGVGRVKTFVRITLGQARGAILGGCLLVALIMLSEYGAFEILGYQTFTTEIFTEFSVAFNVPAAAALSLVLVVLSLVVLSAETTARGRLRISRSGPLSQRQLPPHRLGAMKIPAVIGFTVFVGLALGVPIGASIYWIDAGGQALLSGVSLLSALASTVLFAAPAAALAVLMALPVALLAIRYPSRAHHALERSTYLVLAMPSLIAFAFSYFSEHYANGFAYQTSPMLILAYAIIFFPLALVPLRASVVQAPARLEEVGRSLGKGQIVVFCRVTLPLLAPGLAAGFCLVFLSAVTELTATLILIPTGVQTLSTQFWAYETNLSYAQAAPFALALIAIAAVPSYLLGRFFDRGHSRARVAL